MRSFIKKSAGKMKKKIFNPCKHSYYRKTKELVKRLARKTRYFSSCCISISHFSFFFSPTSFYFLFFYFFILFYFYLFFFNHTVYFVIFHSTYIMLRSVIFLYLSISLFCFLSYHANILQPFTFSIYICPCFNPYHRSRVTDVA